MKRSLAVLVLAALAASCSAQTIDDSQELSDPGASRRGHESIEAVAADSTIIVELETPAGWSSSDDENLDASTPVRTRLVERTVIDVVNGAGLEVGDLITLRVTGDLDDLGTPFVGFHLLRPWETAASMDAGTPTGHWVATNPYDGGLQGDPVSIRAALAALELGGGSDGVRGETSTSLFLSSPPVRLFESRTVSTLPTVDGDFDGVGRLDAREVIELPVAGRGEISPSAVAAVFNVTAIRPDQAGFITAWPCDSERPTTASLNYAAGAVVSNSLTVGLDADGAVCVFTSRSTDLVVDFTGAFAEGGFDPVAPIRLLESRDLAESRTVDGQFEGIGPVAAGSVLDLAIGSRGGLSGDGAAVVLNIAVVRPATNGFLTAYPCDETEPSTASVNFARGSVTSNSVIVPVGADGAVCLVSSADTDLVVDSTGTIPEALLGRITPSRLSDTRPESSTVDGREAGNGRLFPVEGVDTQIVSTTGRGGIPGDATAVALSVAAIASNLDPPGFLTVYPCASERPPTATLTFDSGVTSNSALIPVGLLGSVCVYASAPVDVVVDVTGFLR